MLFTRFIASKALTAAAGSKFTGNTCGYIKSGTVHDGRALTVLSTVAGNGRSDVIALGVLGRGQYQRDGSCEFRVGFSFPYPANNPSKHRIRVGPGKGGLYPDSTIDVSAADLLSGHSRLNL